MKTQSHRTIRTFWSIVALLFLLSAVATPAQAQLRKLKKKAKQATSQQEKEKPATEAPAAEAAPSTTSPPGAEAPTVETPPAEAPPAEAPAEENPLVSGATLIRNPDLPSPAPTYFSLLEGVQHTAIYSNGRFGFFGGINAVFLPAVEGDKRYSPFGKGDAIMAHQIKKVDDGTIIQTEIYDGWPQKGGPFYKFSGTDFAEGFEKGDYVIEWFLEGELFYRMPISIDVLESGDVYKPGKKLFLEGPWNNTMAVYMPSDARLPLKFGFWYRDKSYERDRISEYWFQIDVKRDGQTVALLPDKKERDERKQGIVTGGDDMRPWWQLRELTPRLAGTSNDLMMGTDLTDGNYEVRFAIISSADGTAVDDRTYHFSVSGGKMQPAGRQVRGETDPLDVIEGGKMDGNGHYFFFESVK